MTPTPQLQALIDGPSLWTGFEHFESVTSTNERALELGRDGAASGLVVVADTQTHGRGRHGRAWVDQGAASSLLVTCFLTAPPGLIPRVPMAVGLALYDSARKAGAECTLKWPNDLLVGEKKCAGVLIETEEGADPNLMRLVIGVGINLDWRGIERDGDSEGWTSLAEASGRDVDRWSFLARFLGALDTWLTDVERAGTTLLAIYRERCKTVGQQVMIETPGGVIEGLAQDITADGALIIGTDAGREVVTAGDVVHVR